MWTGLSLVVTVLFLIENLVLRRRVRWAQRCCSDLAERVKEEGERANRERSNAAGLRVARSLAERANRELHVSLEKWKRWAKALASGSAPSELTEEEIEELRKTTFFSQFRWRDDNGNP